MEDRVSEDSNNDEALEEVQKKEDKVFGKETVKKMMQQ